MAPPPRKHAGAHHLPGLEERHDVVQERIREGAEAVPGLAAGTGRVASVVARPPMLGGCPAHFVEQVTCNFRGRFRGTSLRLQPFQQFARRSIEKDGYGYGEGVRGRNGSNLQRGLFRILRWRGVLTAQESNFWTMWSWGRWSMPRLLGVGCSSYGFGLQRAVTYLHIFPKRESKYFHSLFMRYTSLLS